MVRSVCVYLQTWWRCHPLPGGVEKYLTDSFVSTNFDFFSYLVKGEYFGRGFKFKGGVIIYKSIGFKSEKLYLFCYLFTILIHIQCFRGEFIFI